MTVQSDLAQAQKYHRLGQYGRVDEICARILETQPDQTDALHLRGLAALSAGRPDRAIELIATALKHNERKAIYHVSLGESYRLAGAPDRALSALQRALEIDADLAEAHCGLGNVFQDRNDADEALSHYRRAIELNPEYAQAHFNTGNLLSARGEHGNAAGAYERAVAASPRFAVAHYNLGNTYRWLGRLDDATTAYETAIGIDSSLALAHLHLGTVLKRQGRDGEAAASVARALDLAPDLVAAHSLMGHLLDLQGRSEEAIACHRRAVELDPNGAMGFIGLSTALNGAGRPAEANEATLKAVRLRRVYGWPFSGRAPEARIVLLDGVEDGCFVLTREGSFKLQVGTTNAAEHFDRSRFSIRNYYIDGLDPEHALKAMPPCDLVFNLISDADAMPRCHEIVKSIAHGIQLPLINPPDSVEKTRRDENYKALKELDGVVFPGTVRLEAPFRSRKQVEGFLEDAGIGYPILVRRAGTHTGKSLEKAESPDHLWAHLSTQQAGWYIFSEFVESVGDRNAYTKMRFFVVDGEMYPSHLYINDAWQVSQARQVKDLMWANDWMIDEAKRFLADPRDYLGDDSHRAIASACARIPLDYFGIDFARLTDGRVLVFEANPVMRLPHEANDPFPFRAPYSKAIHQALNRLLEKKLARSG